MLYRSEGYQTLKKNIIEYLYPIGITKCNKQFLYTQVVYKTEVIRTSPRLVQIFTQLANALLESPKKLAS